MNEYKKSHIELKYDMLVLQKYLLLILKICNISAEELANKIGVTDHLIRNFMSDPVRAIMPRTTFISIMSILEIEMKRNENGYLLRLLLQSIFTVSSYYTVKKMYEPDLISLRSKSKKVLTKATDTKELNSLNSLQFVQLTSTPESLFNKIMPTSNELAKEAEAMTGSSDPTDDEEIHQWVQELVSYLGEHIGNLTQEILNDKSLDTVEKASEEYSKRYQDLYVEAFKKILPKYYPEDFDGDDLSDDDIDFIKQSCPKEKIINPFVDKKTEDGIPIWLDLVYSAEKIDEKLNNEIDNLVLKEKQLDNALEKLFLFYKRIEYNEQVQETM